MANNGIIIIGSNGQLGIALKNKYPEALAVDFQELDITDYKALSAFDWSNIGTIINAAAYTNVDGAEADEGRISAWKVNAIGAANLARIANDNSLTLVHISTDYVFDGANGIHLEDEPFSPLGVYGQTKAAGDIAVGLCGKHYIIRTSWVIGEGKNFVRTMLELGKKGVSPSVVSDQLGRLTFTSELVKAIDFMLTNNASFGTYNVSCEGDIVSWAEITRQVYSYAGFDLNVTDISTNDYFAGKSGVAPRPLKSTLNLAKIESIGYKPNDWRDDLREYVKKEMSK